MNKAWLWANEDIKDYNMKNLQDFYYKKFESDNYYNRWKKMTIKSIFMLLKEN